LLKISDELASYVAELEFGDQIADFVGRHSRSECTPNSVPLLLSKILLLDSIKIIVYF